MKFLVLTVFDLSFFCNEFIPNQFRLSRIYYAKTFSAFFNTFSQSHLSEKKCLLLTYRHQTHLNITPFVFSHQVLSSSHAACT